MMQLPQPMVVVVGGNLAMEKMEFFYSYQRT
jgi:hypothetical protein